MSNFKDIDPACTFRIGTLADVQAILPLMADYYLHDRLPFERERMRGGLERLLGEPALGRVWVVENGAKAIGYLALTFGFTLEAAGREAYVDEFFIAAENRGQGTGERLLRHVMEVAPELEVKLIRLEVTRHNERASHLYKRLGFEDWGRFLLAFEP